MHRFVTNGADFAVFVTHDQIRIHLLDLLYDESELRNTIRIKLVLVTKGHWLKSEKSFASLVHWLDRFFEPGRRGNRAKLTTGANNYSDPTCHGHSTNTGNKGLLLRARFANADGVGFACCTSDVSADIDVVTAGGQIAAS